MHRPLLAAALAVAAGVALPGAPAPLTAGRQAAPAGRAAVSYAEARPILETLRADLLPAELRALPPAEREAAWPAWAAGHDAAIRARLARGDEDSVGTFLLFGVTFTRQPRYSFTVRPGSTPAPSGRAEDVVPADPVVQARLADLVRGLAAAGTNERLQFARRVVERQGIDPTTATGRVEAQAFLAGALRRMLADYDASFRDGGLGSTRFHDRGLSSDTSIYAAFAIDRTLAELQANGMLQPGGVRRVAVVGPGLDFADKQEGLDVYPVQTIQPFAVVDSLLRLGLSRADAIQVSTYDLSPRVNDHLAAAVQRAQAGRGYAIQLPRDAAQRWAPGLVAYWERFGDRVGETVAPVAPPPGLGQVQLRAVGLRPAVVRAVTPSDLNVVLERPAPLAEDGRVDLVIATNILIYYDVFEQSLALANIASMLRPGGLLLTNTPLFELPVTPMSLAGETRVAYTETGEDWVAWYRRK